MSAASSRRFLLALLALAGLLLGIAPAASAAKATSPATAKAAAKKKSAKKKSTKKKVAFPTISKVTPARARVGETLTIRGRNYLVGKNRTTVVFKRDGKKPIFVKASISTKTMIKVSVPKTLETQLATQAGYPLFTKFRLRIGAKRFGKRYTANKLSVGPEAQPGVDIDQCAKVRTGSDPQGDLDGDLLTNAEELGLRNPLNPCAADSDGDTLQDGWEYFSAKDLNQRALPYPAKRPFPNGLDPADANYDYDGDGLRAKQEHDLWVAFGKPSQTMADRDQLLYSDGTQTSNGPGPSQLADLGTLQQNAAACGDTIVPPNLGYLGRGYVDASVQVEDDEKDADHDGLSNWAEANGYFRQEWWAGVFASEAPYPLRNFQNLEATDNDADGDGCLDGLDDQDTDDWPNWTEHGEHFTTWIDGAANWTAFGAVGLYPGWWGWETAALTKTVPFAANPFNPCLPETTSRTCSKYVRPTYPPFTDSYTGEDACIVPVPYRGRTIYVWVWDYVEEQLWSRTDGCPP